MATHFELLIESGDAGTARGSARECFRELERIEDLLSRFRQGSDVDRINHLRAGESIAISEICHECLLAAFEAAALTEGWFDPATGGMMDLLRSRCSDAAAWAAAHLARGRGHLTIDPGRPFVRCDAEGLAIDLGGVGKGFALGRLAALIRDLGCTTALLHGGTSTALGMGCPSGSAAGWPVALAAPKGRTLVHLQDAALSASGSAVQGAHVLNRGEVVKSYPLERVWVRTVDPALADALSTALLVMPEDVRRRSFARLGQPVDAWGQDSSGDVVVLL